MKVLVVDDSKAMRMIIMRQLRDCEMVDDVLEADSAVAAAERLQDVFVDLILSDWNMPGLSGLELLTWLRAQGWEGTFGFITSESGAATTSQAMDAGAAFVLRKPFKGDELAAALAGVAGGGAAPGREPPEPREGGAVGNLSELETVAAILEGTLSRAVAVRAAAGPPLRSSARVSAQYVDVDGVAAAMCVADSSLAASAGAALSRFSPEEAASWASSGVLPQDLTENYYEVANILAQLGGAEGKRCLLSDLTVYAPGEKLVEAARVDAAPEHLHMHVEIDGYGSGRLSFTRY